MMREGGKKKKIQLTYETVTGRANDLSQGNTLLTPSQNDTLNTTVQRCWTTPSRPSDDGGKKRSKGRKQVATITTTTNMARASIPRAVLKFLFIKVFFPPLIITILCQR
jgi:hypothetical protein